MSSPSLLLATSIPPQLRGVPFDAGQLTSLQQRALHSWRRCGFTPCSLHTARELMSRPGHGDHLLQAGITPLRLDQEDTEPLPNLHASLSALVSIHPSALIAITNADILFADSPALPLALQSLKPHQALLGRRRNVPADFDLHDAIEGATDVHGFDFIAVHASSLRAALPLLPESLVFGRPWWDLFLPMALLASGLELRDPGPDLLLHPHHDERWNAQQWFAHGQSADRRFLELLRRQGRNAFCQRWSHLRRRAIRRWPGLTGLRHRVREQRRSLLRQGRLLPLHLSDVSEAINTLLETERTVPPRP